MAGFEQDGWRHGLFGEPWGRPMSSSERLSNDIMNQHTNTVEDLASGADGSNIPVDKKVCRPAEDETKDVHSHVRKCW